MSTSTTDSQLQDQAFSEHRLGLMILENRAGAALAAAIPHFTSAIAIWRQLNWPTRVAEIQLDLGRLHSKTGNYAEAAALSAEAVHAFAGAGDERAIDAGILAGKAYLEVNQAPPALRSLRRAAEIADERNDHLRIAAVQVELGRALIASGGPDDATAALTSADRALKIFDSYKRKIEVARCQEVIANAQTIAGNAPAAVAAYEAAIAIYTELGRPVETGDVLSRFADWQRDRGDLGAAEGVLDRALALYTQTGKQGLVAQTLRRLGTVHAKRGDATKADERYRRSLELCRSLDDHEGLSRTYYLLGAADLRAGLVDDGLTKL